MTKHILKYEIGRTHEDSFHVIVILTTSPKSETLLNKFIGRLDQFLNYDYFNFFNFDVIISLDDMQVPLEYHDRAITIEAMYTILKEQKEGKTNGNSWNTIATTGRKLPWLL